MNSWRYGVAVGLLSGLGACSHMMGSNSHRSEPAAQAAPVEPTVAPEMVKKVQSKLRDGGYYKQGAVDGVWGDQTQTAVRSFQHDHNLGSSGQLDVATLKALNVTDTGQATNAGSPTQPTATDNNAQPTAANPNGSPANSNPSPANPNPSPANLNSQPTTTNPTGTPANNAAAPPAH